MKAPKMLRRKDNPMAAALIAACQDVLARPAWQGLGPVTVAHVDTAHRLVVFATGQSSLAVYEDGRVFRVWDDEGWTGGRAALQPVLTSRADLLAVL